MRYVKFAGAFAGLVMAATSASAVTVVQYRQTVEQPSLQLVNNGDNYTLSTIGNQVVRVTLFDPANEANNVVVDANYTFTANGSGPADVLGNNFAADFNQGFFSLTALDPFSFLGSTGTNILSGSFTNGALSGQLGTLAPTFSVSIPQSAITGVMSDFFTDPQFRLTNFSLGMSDATPPVDIGGDGRLNNFVSSSVGTFGASVVPEPGTWAMMIMGFGLVGFASRRRRAVTSVSA